MSNFVSVTRHGLFDENGKYATTLGGQDIFNMNEIMSIFDKLRSEYRISKIEIQVSNNSTTPLQHGTSSNNLGGNVWVRHFDDSNSSNWVCLPNIKTKANNSEGANNSEELILNYVVYNCLTEIANSEVSRYALRIKKRPFIETAILKVVAHVR